MEGQKYRWIDAASPTTPLEALIALARDKNASVRLAVAGNPTTPLKSLALLAEDVSTAIRMAVARNRATPTGVLTALASDANEDVRLEAKRNLSTLTKTAMPQRRRKAMKITAEHISIYRAAGAYKEALEWAKAEPREYGEALQPWRVWVASNYSTPSDVLVELAHDEDSNVRQATAVNPSTPPEALTFLAAADPDDLVRKAIAQRSERGT